MMDGCQIARDIFFARKTASQQGCAYSAASSGTAVISAAKGRRSAPCLPLRMRTGQGSSRQVVARFLASRPLGSPFFPVLFPRPNRRFPCGRSARLRPQAPDARVKWGNGRDRHRKANPQKFPRLRPLSHVGGGREPMHKPSRGGRSAAGLPEEPAARQDGEPSTARTRPPAQAPCCTRQRPPARKPQAVPATAAAPDPGLHGLTAPRMACPRPPRGVDSANPELECLP